MSVNRDTSPLSGSAITRNQVCCHFKAVFTPPLFISPVVRNVTSQKNKRADTVFTVNTKAEINTNCMTMHFSDNGNAAVWPIRMATQ